MFEHRIPLSVTSAKSNIAPYKIIMSSKPESDCSYRLCMLHNQVKSRYAPEKHLFQEHNAVRCDLTLFLLDFTATYWILLSVKSLINDTGHYSNTPQLSDTSPPKNEDKVRRHCEVTLLKIPNLTRSIPNLHESSKNCKGMHQLRYDLKITSTRIPVNLACQSNRKFSWSLVVFTKQKSN